MLKSLFSLPVIGGGGLLAKAIEFQFFGGRERYREFNRKAKEVAVEYVSSVKLLDQQACSEAPSVDSDHRCGNARHPR